MGDQVGDHVAPLRGLVKLRPLAPLRGEEVPATATTTTITTTTTNYVSWIEVYTYMTRYILSFRCSMLHYCYCSM